jgi:hypothetical protein
MKQKIKLIVAGLTVLILWLSAMNVLAQKNKKDVIKGTPLVITTGLQDRDFWANTLYKIAYPVVHNLANETLKKNMPLEKGPDYYLNIQAVTYLEAVGRTFAGIAPWLALPDDDSKEGIMRSQLRAEVLKGLVHAVDPASADYLNFRTGGQPIVDAAYLAQAFLRAPKALWDPLDSVTKLRFIEEFKSLRTRKGAYNNWLLFSGITEAFLLKINAGYDPARIDFAYHKMNEWYVGDGWYSDGAKFSFDYYNSYVIHSMLVDMFKVMADKKLIANSEYELSVKRMVRYSEFLERLISPEGTYPAFGRSITYRTAAFQALAQTALMEKLPSYIEPAQVRCALTKVMHNMYDGDQNFDRNGWLVLGFNGHQPEVADQYTSTGSLYMATLGFLTLGLPADNPFWTDVPAEWSSVKAWRGKPLRKDYKVEY